MKKLTALLFLTSLFLGWSSFSHAGVSAVFTGKKYIATITEHCDEGNVSCGDVSFDSKSIMTGNEIRLKGKTVNINCPDVCDFRGYEFHNGAYLYYLVAGNGDEWNFYITKNGKEISKDVGVFK